ncbi:MAG: TonB-dependent receptor [Flavobacteriales bacterium]|nr:TonB-dependent receptor [Bacteroidia bacterium]PCJ77897.1 MAG: TonB-dependent receptor [Flavobacteriales bacterium]
MNLKLLTTFILLTQIVFAQGQQGGHGEGNWNPENIPKGKIVGVVKDAESGQPIEYATISLFSIRDSSLISGAITQENGKYEIESRVGRFFMKIEFISYETQYISNISLKPKSPYLDLGETSIKVSAQTLSEIEIAEDRNQLQVGLDKKVFNVDKDLNNIGGSAQDVLQNIPSVQVDMDGSVSLRGSNNVRILIDGKPSGLTGISTNEALEQIPANTIQSIEVITNPSVKYDAEGMAGIINIILKKEKKKGFNGLISLSTALPHKHSTSLTWNYKIRKFNFFGTQNVSYRESPGIAISHREITSGNSFIVNDQNGDFTRARLTNSSRLGFDYFLNELNTITVSGLYKLSDGNNSRHTDYRNYDINSQLTDAYYRNSSKDEIDKAMEYALGYKKLFKKKSRYFTMDAQYSDSYEDENESISEHYLNVEDLTPSDLSPLSQRVLTKESQSSGLVQADYSHPFKENGKFEGGYKSSFKSIDKDYNIEEYNDSTLSWLNLTNISNHFIYSEVIHAGYGMISNKWKKLNYQIGLRSEFTDISTELKESALKSEKSYLNFFPSAHFTQDIKGNNKLQFSYSRRIRRPGFWNLNPFWSYANPLNLWVGNPDLNPEYTHSFEFGDVKYWDKSTLTGSIYYRHTDGVIQRIRTIDSNGVATAKPYNLSSRESFGVEATFSSQIKEWWKINGSINYYRNIVDGGNIGEFYASDFYGWTGRINSMTTLFEDITLQLMFNYRSPRETIQGTRRQRYFMDIGLKKPVLKNKGELSFRVSDVFDSRKFEMDSYIGDTYLHSQYRHGPRTFFLSFNYKINRYKPSRRNRNYNYDMDGMGM